MEAGTIASWTLAEGETFLAGDVLCEIETDKATMSFEAQDEGIIAKILADAGTNEIQCGEPICITVEEEGDVDAFKDYVVETGVAGSLEEVSAAAVVEAAVPVSVVPPPVAVVPPPARDIPVAAGGGGGVDSGRTVASPLAWQLAKGKGLNLADIAIIGSGPDGRIIADDVREFIPQPAAASIAEPSIAATAPPPSSSPTPPPVHHDNYTDYPLSPTSIQSANLLTHSKQTVPHYYLTVDVTLDNLLALRTKLNAHTPSDSTGITLDDLLLKATACAMKSCPDANASWQGESVRQYHSVDINYVVGNGQTMYAPLIAGVDKRGLGSISEEIADCLAKVTPVDGADDVLNDAVLGNEVGTVTVMNLGMYGVKSCAPIIREPQAVALALGAAENRMVPKEMNVMDEEEGGDNYDVKVMLTATLSCDHRVVDGAVGAQWLSSFKAAVENPEILLL